MGLCARNTLVSTWLEMPDAEVRASLAFLLDRCQPHEVAAVLACLRCGALDGDDGRYCVIGIVARCRGTKYTAAGLISREVWPFEAWLRQIHIGDTPVNSPHARLLEQWLIAWLDERTIEIPQEVLALPEPVPCAGQLGLWELDAVTLAAVERQL